MSQKTNTTTLPTPPPAQAVMSVYKPTAPVPYAHAELPYLTDADVPTSVLMQTLWRACRVKRPDTGEGEARFVAWLANRLPVTMIDGAGNVHVDTRKGPQHRTMFTAHTDTVHRRDGENLIRLDTTDPRSIKWRADAGSCLGADDGAGVALLMHMLDEGVPGYYVFFRGEECGGTGSTWLAQEMPTVLDELDRCISFDRADYMDVITHQAGERCCSDEFAKALADALTTDDLALAFVADSTGVFTDSANLTREIAECTNVSVGYKHQHGDGEWQDVSFLVLLAAQLVLVPWDDLPVKRDPLVFDTDAYASWGVSYLDTRADSTGQYDVAKKTNVYLRNKCDTSNAFYKEILVEALYDAYAGSYINIKQLVAEYAIPDDPDSAYPFINPFVIKPEKYDSLATELDNGTKEYQTVLDWLYERLVVN
jgi:hypothetical protein